MTIEELLEAKQLDYQKLKKSLVLKHTRSTGKGGQKKNKTSSAIQLIDTFDYTSSIPEENRSKIKSTFSTISDERDQKKNYEIVLNKWENYLKNLFSTKKERGVNQKLEKKRKEKAKKEALLLKSKLNYKNRNNYI